MDIKMPVTFHGSYQVTMRSGDVEKKETCQKLTFSRLSSQGQGESDPGESQKPTHLITYFSFGCRRMLEGKIKENEENRVVFQVDDREFEFSPSRPVY
jgi:hypothetical protein